MERVIGEGAFGKVKVAEHLETGARVAIKVISKEKLSSEKKRVYLQNEMDVLKQLNHPNVIKLFQIVETNTKIYLVMEYAPEGDLFNYMTKKKRLDEREAFFWLKQLVEALEYLHSLKITHRCQFKQGFEDGEHYSLGQKT